MSDNRNILCDRVEEHLERPLRDEERDVISRLTPGTTIQEAIGLSKLKLRSAPPVACGPEMVDAPARGAMRVTMPRRLVGNASLRDGYCGRLRMEEADVFDAMMKDARDRAARRNNDAFTPPFTPGQIAMARHYRALVERHDTGGMKCSSLEAQRGDGSGGAFMDAFMDEGREIARIRARIGNGQAMALRRIRPSSRGSRMAISDRTLVDMVCLEGLTLTEVLAHHGWAKSAKVLNCIREALCAALNRMQGYRD